MSTEWYRHRKEIFLEQLFQRSLFATAILNRQEVVLDINIRFTELFGYTREEALGAYINDLIVPSRYELEAGRFKAVVLNHHTMRDKTMRRHKDGTLLEVEAVGSPVIIDGESYGFFAMYRDIRVEEAALREMNRLLNTDSLTGLFNRKYIYDRIRHLSNQSHQRFIIYYLDLDLFKEVNDLHGHEAGDYVLQEVANRLLSVLKDCGEAARVGGDEFLILATDSLHCSWVELENNIRKSLQPSYWWKGQTLTVPASLGIAVFPEDSKDGDGLISAADKRMYEEKKQRRIRRIPLRQDPK
ncbi:sensor domain-containing diguanylate cyclase [Tindallia californiensis]|uniref:Ammonium transporter, Amt family n=1 Tax=Tindallia californiensis TaxID=159292 RepID=A0A1H3LPY2_9FIRM|nr:sensor domain-containing diguanylate cyclase [Tindallia californiensis]SDY66423.1 ammonium transporter, Amt family [Tindallia californiensis]